MRKTYLKNRRLSWKAKGILTYLLENPKTDIHQLIKASRDQRTSVHTGLQELKEEGYLDRFAIRNLSGQFDFYVNLIEGYSPSEFEAFNMTDVELIECYKKNKESFPNQYEEILKYVIIEMEKRKLNKYL